MGDHHTPIKEQWSPFLVQLKNVLKGETPSKIRDRQSPNFVQRDSGLLIREVSSFASAPKTAGN